VEPALIAALRRRRETSLRFVDRGGVGETVDRSGSTCSSRRAIILWVTRKSDLPRGSELVDVLAAERARVWAHQAIQPMAEGKGPKQEVSLLAALVRMHAA
jgi:hypothetical protein